MTTNLTDPPRVSRRARIALLFGDWAQAGWLLSLILLASAVMSIGRAHFDFWTFVGVTATTTGEVAHVREIHHTGGRYGSAWTQYAHRYTFWVGGVMHSGESFGRRRADGEVEVEYVVADPAKARIVGMASRQVSGTVTLLALAAFGGCIGWTIWRQLQLDRLASAIRAKLSQPPPYRAHGFLPKIRLDRNDQLVTWNGVWLLLVPGCGAIAFALLVDYYVF